MDLSSLLIDFHSVLAMGLIILSAYAGIWSVKEVVSLAADSDSTEKEIIYRKKMFSGGTFLDVQMPDTYMEITKFDNQFCVSRVLDSYSTYITEDGLLSPDIHEARKFDSFDSVSKFVKKIDSHYEDDF